MENSKQVTAEVVHIFVGRKSSKIPYSEQRLRFCGLKSKMGRTRIRVMW
jgi:hypothetical protein